MRTLFDDTSVFHNKNFIGIADRGETMKLVRPSIRRSRGTEPSDGK